MNIPTLSSKFNRILKEQGAFSVLSKMQQYLLFLAKKNWYKLKGIYAEIEKGGLKIIIHTGKAKIYYKGWELTKGNGIAALFSVLTSCYDSAESDWSITKIDNSKLVLKNRCKNLPLNQLWEISLSGESEINLNMKLELEEDLKIDKKMVIFTFSETYNKWEVPFEGAGVFYSNDDSCDILFIFDQQRPECSIENLPHSKVIKMLIPETMAQGEYLPGVYNFFSAKLSLFAKNAEGRKRLSVKCEENMDIPKMNFLGNSDAEAGKRNIGDFTVVLVNLPWQRNGCSGVRAGSRWPHIKDKAEGAYFPFPFYLAYAAALLQKNGFKVKLIDAIAEEISETVFINMLSNIKVDLLLAETSTVSLEDDIVLLKKIKKENTRLALCGPDINIRSREFLEENIFVNYVLAGEYEFTLLNLAINLREGKELSEVSGLIYRDSAGKIQFNQPRVLADNLDDLPWPLREQLPVKKYLDAPCEIPYPTAQMWASRGCPFKCIFCLWPQIMYASSKYRVRNVVDVVDEMVYLVKNMGFKSIYFDDDTFNIGKPRMLEFCREIKKRKLKVPWAIMARADLMDEEILTEMKSAGLYAVKYGVESAAQELLDNSNKGMDLEKATRMILFTKRLGIKTHLTFTFGLPGETVQTIQKTVNYVFKVDPDSAQFSITTYYPGTEYFNYLDKNKLLLTKNWADYDGNRGSIAQLEGLNAEYLDNARKDAVGRWLAHLRLKRGFNENYQVFKRYLNRQGLRFTVKKTLSYFKLKYISSVLARSREFNVKIKNTVKRIIRYAATGKAYSDYLDILGIFDGSYAYKGPNFVQVDLTNNCNNDCIGCWCNSPLLLDKKHDEETRRKTIPYWKVKGLIDEFHQMGAKEIYLAGGGEPFMHPMIMEVVGYIKAKGLICDINTNFTLVDEDKIRKIIQLKVDALVVSVWAATAKTYVSTHPNKNEDTFYKIKQRLKFLNCSKNNFPKVHIYNVITNLNFHEIEAMVDFALEVKADSVGFTVLDTIPGRTDVLLLNDEQRKQVLRQCARIKCRGDLGNLKILEFDKFESRIAASCAKTAEYDKEAIKSVPCSIGWLFSRIMADGNVNACLKAHRIPVGNIYKQDFKGIWNGLLQQEFRGKTLCRKKNEPFFSLIGNDPEAENGCYKGCDDFSRNLYIQRRISKLTFFERINLKSIAALKKMHRNIKFRFLTVLPQRKKVYFGNISCREYFDIVLVIPPPWAAKMPPLGAAYLSSYLKEKKFKPVVCDLNLELCNKAKGKNKLFWQVGNLNNKSPEDVAKDVVTAFKKEFSLFVDELCFVRSEVIGFSTSLINLWVALEITKMIKSKNPGKIVVFGGPGCFWDYKRIPAGIVDAFVIGEGEEVLCDILSAVKEGRCIKDIPGVVTYANGSYREGLSAKPLDINTIPHPGFREFKLKEYNKNNNYKPLPILTSRGCIGRCNYCIDCRMWGALRHRLAENVFEEVESHIKNFGVWEFEFNDLICNGNLAQLEKFCDLVIKSGRKINWVSYAIIRKDMSLELFAKMKKGGCHTLIYGVESGSNTVLKRMNKYYSAEDAEKIIRFTHQAGICTNINIIAGFPGETEFELNETLEFLKRNREYIDEVTNVSGCVLFLGSEMGNSQDKFGVLLPQKADPLLYQDKTGLTPEIRKERVRKTLLFISDLGIKCRIINNPTERRIKVSRINAEFAGNLKEG